MNLNQFKLGAIAILGSLILLGCNRPSSPSISWEKLEAGMIMPDNGLAGALIGTSNNQLIVAGGANFPESMPWEGGAKKYHKALYIYDIDSGKIVPKRREQLAIAKGYTANAQFKKGFVCAGGENNTEVFPSVDYFYMKGDSLIRESLIDLPMPLTGGALVNIHDDLYYIGGHNKSLVSNKVWRLSANDTQWTELVSLPKAISFPVGLSWNDKILVAGGRASKKNAVSEFYSEVYLLDPISKELSLLESLPTRLAAGTGVVDSNGGVWVFGGDLGEVYNKTEELLLAIDLAEDEALKSQLIAQKDSLQMNHPGFDRNIYYFDGDSWSIKTALPFDMPVTTTALIQGDLIIIPNGEIRAGVRTHCFLLGNLKE